MKIDLETKTCSKCKQKKDPKEFSKDRTCLGGRYPSCKSCRQEYDIARRDRPYETVTRKECTKCGIEKLAEEFSPHLTAPDRLASQCKLCRNNWQKENYTAESGGKNRNLKLKYGISLEIFGMMMESQDHKCAICNIDLKDRIPCVDHCHTTNNVRGILCKQCNTMLGYAKDNTQTLQNAINYLDRGK